MIVPRVRMNAAGRQNATVGRLVDRSSGQFYRLSAPCLFARQFFSGGSNVLLFHVRVIAKEPLFQWRLHKFRKHDVHYPDGQRSPDGRQDDYVKWPDQRIDRILDGPNGESQQQLDKLPTEKSADALGFKYFAKKHRYFEPNKSNQEPTGIETATASVPDIAETAFENLQERARKRFRFVHEQRPQAGCFLNLVAKPRGKRRLFWFSTRVLSVFSFDGRQRL